MLAMFARGRYDARTQRVEIKRAIDRGIPYALCSGSRRPCRREQSPWGHQQALEMCQTLLRYCDGLEGWDLKQEEDIADGEVD